uniref:Cystatin n=1 Tax=Rhipicephalus appendiculatus TaxID=34631 RepID=A0A131YBE9_RHIAP
MAGADASALLVALLLSIFKGSFQVGEWIEDMQPNRFENRVLARFAYARERHQRGAQLRFFVTQARGKFEGGKVVSLGFIVYQGDAMLEKCLATIFASLHGTPQRRLVITKFWCRQSF